MSNLLSLIVTTIKYSIGAVLLGIFLGYIVGVTGFYWEIPFVYRFAAATKSIPVTGLLPLFIATFGYETMVLPMATLPIIAMVCVNIWDSSRRLSTVRMQTRHLLGASFSQYYKHVMFWETLEVVIATARVSLPYALALVVALDYFLGNIDGIGGYLSSSSSQYDVNGQYSAIVLIAIAGILQIALLDSVSRKLLVWK